MMYILHHVDGYAIIYGLGLEFLLAMGGWGTQCCGASHRHIFWVRGPGGPRGMGGRGENSQNLVILALVGFTKGLLCQNIRFLAILGPRGWDLGTLNRDGPWSHR